MIHDDNELDMRINSFLARKSEQFPEVFEDSPRRRLSLSDITSLFSPPKLRY